MNLDVSICIPTYNRASLLEKNLQHLLTFSSTGYELIIGDNASEDATPEIVAKYRDNFSDLVYLRHTENLGVARNVDSILRLAKRKYIYTVCDDDLVFEGALVLMANTMNGNPLIAAMMGKYLSQSITQIGMTMDYSDAIVSILAKGSYQLVVNNVNVCDGHPFMRREIFQRFCDLTNNVSLVSLYFQLLSKGSLVQIQKPVFQHLRNKNSLTSSMAEPWFLDAINADLEVAFSFVDMPEDILNAFRSNALKNQYLQGARMVRAKGDYLWFWQLLRRLKSLKGEMGGFFEKCERNFIIEVATHKVVSILKDTNVKKVHYEDVQSVSVLISNISSMLGEDIEINSLSDKSELSSKDIVIVERYDNVPQAQQGCHKIALFDIISALRLTSHKMALGLGSGTINVTYTEPDVQKLSDEYSVFFERVCIPYSFE